MGAGICGLFTAYKLARLGFDVVIIEAASRVGSGSSSRNEGWLHSGTYHASSVTDRATALRVARNCAAGHEQIRRLFPESLEPMSNGSVALVRDPARAEESESRWSESAVQFSTLTPRDTRARLPEVELSEVHRSYLVADAGINTRILHRVLLTEATLRGARLFLRHTLNYAADGAPVLLNVDGGRRALSADFTVLATGFQSGNLLSSLDSISALRMWKSHVLYGPQLTSCPVFWLDPGEATLINHSGDVSVIGLNEDARRIPDVDVNVDEVRAEAVRNALIRLIPDVDPKNYTAAACVKVDWGRNEDIRSVEMQIREVAEGTFMALPGKLTEAPVLADRLARILAVRTEINQTSSRPWDRI
ncbi:FAD-dependent oxidoreductase [Streptomyces sp. VNUA74]|nr:FAD-dependent oxidoreductase [Streptomyces sp. VNUA74]WML84585.1 FAD-dependent oxidoreductase [Streptomyces sp. VNUA74]